MASFSVSTPLHVPLHPRGRMLLLSWISIVRRLSWPPSQSAIERPPNRFFMCLSPDTHHCRNLEMILTESRRSARASLPPPPAREGGTYKPNNVKKNFVNVLESERRKHAPLLALRMWSGGLELEVCRLLFVVRCTGMFRFSVPSVFQRSKATSLHGQILVSSFTYLSL